jgi:hypothetical protein
VRKPGLAWAWYSYPGLVLAFFTLMEWSGHGATQLVHPLGYIRSGQWALDRQLVSRAWQPLPHLTPLPRLLVIPIAITGAAWLSVIFWRWLEGLLRRGNREGLPAADERAVLRSRLLASFVAINTFFWFADPLQGLLGANGGQVVRSLVLLLTSLGLYRAWGRDPATYRRESTSDSLRRQLRDLPGLEPALDGRNLDALSPLEVFTLVKAMPAVGELQARRVYGEVLLDMLRSGRLDQAQSLLDLQELRQSLQLDDEDHHAVIDLLAKQHPELLGRNRFERQRDDLRRELALAHLEDFLMRHGFSVFDAAALNPRQRQELERLRLATGLPEPGWESVLRQFGPQGELERQQLEPLRATWLEEAGLLAWLDGQLAEDGLLRPLQRVLTRRVGELQRQLAPRLAAAGLDPLPPAMAPAGDLRRVFDLLWLDPDPDTAAWVLMLERQRHPEAVARRLQDPRPGLASSPFLQGQLRGDATVDEALLAALTGWSMFDDVLPAGLLWLAQRGTVRQFPAGEPVMEKGSISDHLALVLEGDVQVLVDGDATVVLGPGRAIGEIGVLTGRRRTASVRAGADGCRLLMLPSATFEDLLRRSDSFSRSLLSQLALRLVDATRKVAA